MQDCLIIKIFNYRNWKDVIDQICSCQFIISSSLHGLIAAEAYNIPNQWVEFKEPLVNDTSRRFKFHDFFLSMGLDRDNPYTITLDTTLKELLNLKGEYTKPKGLSLSPLVEACPFRIKEKYRKKIV
jgi:pyruvyltransferase